MKKMDITVTINKPVKVVWGYMNDPDTMPEWLDTLERYELISGESGRPGSIGLHHYNENGRKYTMQEEVIEMRENEYLKLALTSKSLDMIIEGFFETPDKNTTRYRAVAEFTRTTLFMKLMMFLFMPYRKAQAQHVKQMNKLKELVEAL